MELGNIKYIFQIPLQWFKTIGDRVFKAYGGNLISVREGAYGGMEVAVNENEFEAAVKEIAGDAGTPTMPEAVTTLVSGYASASGGSGYTTSAAKSGKNDSTFTAAGSDGNGLEIMIPTRICTDGESGPLVFRKFKFNGSGQLCSVEAESSAVGIYTDLS